MWKLAESRNFLLVGENYIKNSTMLHNVQEGKCKGCEEQEAKTPGPLTHF